MNENTKRPEPEKVKEDKRRWPAIRAEEKLREYKGKVTVINGKKPNEDY